MHPFFAVKPYLILYPFRYFERGRWFRARYVAELHVIARNEKWEIVGPPEIGQRGGGWNSSNPYREPPAAHLPVEEPPPSEEPPAREPPDNEPPDPPIEEPPPGETTKLRFLDYVLYFLRCYVTWCARTRRFEQAKHAAKLHRAVRYAGR
jgi:hypothetical protein